MIYQCEVLLTVDVLTVDADGSSTICKKKKEGISLYNYVHTYGIIILSTARWSLHYSVVLWAVNVMYTWCMWLFLVHIHKLKFLHMISKHNDWRSIYEQWWAVSFNV